MRRTWQNKGKKVFGVQLLFADPGHKKELAVWEETLRTMAREFLDPGADLETEDFLEKVMENITGR